VCDIETSRIGAPYIYIYIYIYDISSLRLNRTITLAFTYRFYTKFLLLNLPDINFVSISHLTVQATTHPPLFNYSDIWRRVDD